MSERDSDRPQPSWFRRPSDDHPGTLNATYQLLDRAVVAGRADEVVLRHPDGEVSVATLLEESAALGGVLTGLGVTAGDPVAVRLDPDRRAVTALLGVARIGAVLADDAALTVSADGIGDVPWDVVPTLGRTDPAPAAVLAADAPWSGAVTVHDLAVVLAAVDGPRTPADLVLLLTATTIGT